MFTPSGTISQTGTVVLSMSISAGTSHFGSVHREHTTSQRQVSRSCWVKAVRRKEGGGLVLCVLSLGVSFYVQEAECHVGIIINNLVGVYGPTTA